VKNSRKTTGPAAGAKKFNLIVQPDKEALEAAIALNGFCEPKKCWHFVAISALIEQMAPGANHHVRVDGAHVRLNYRGWRYIADMPMHVKRSILYFDRGMYDRIHARNYELRFRRTTKIIPSSQERKNQINAARLARAAAGKPDRTNYQNLRKRVEGLSGIV
jgi:hypothetical protein